MFDLSFPELFLIVIVAIVVFGPQDLPKILYGFGRIVRRLNYLRFSLSRQFDSFMDEHSQGNIPGSVNFEQRPHTPPSQAAPSPESRPQEPPP